MVGIRQVTYEQSFNRNLFLLKLTGDSIKTEFTFFPFPRIEPGQNYGALPVDSLIDITVNKLFTIYQKPRSRDFIDLYCILKHKPEWNLEDLMKKARVKFDHFLDPLQLSAQFVKAETLRDYPKMIVEIDNGVWQKFFLESASRLAGKELE
jgi:predicted nucleotidyltransferase component of viral defense system